MAFSETFLCTALPEGITGTKVRMAVLVSPRLQSDSTAPAALENWPDARDWPAIAPTWEVTITQGSTTVTFTADQVTEVKSGDYDLAGWRQLFPATMPTVPYTPTDRSEAPIFSYPVAKVRDAVRAVHTKVLTDARTEFPAVEDLGRIPAFMALKRAADPDFLLSVLESQSDGPIPDAQIDTAEAFAMAELFHGVRPGSEKPPLPPPPTVTGVSPSSATEAGGTPVTITGTNLGGASAVHFGTGLAAGVAINAAGTQLTCTSPTHTITGSSSPPETVDVTVTTPSGSSALSPAARFTYINDVPDPIK